MVDAEAQLVRVRRSLADLSGLRIIPKSSFAKTFIACPSGKPAYPSAGDVKRPELGLLAAQGQLLVAQEELERSLDRPKLGAFATAGYGRPGINALSDEFDAYFIGGVQLQVPLTYLYTGTRGNASKQREVQQQLLDRQRDSFMMQVRVQLDGQFAEVERLRSAMRIDEALLEARIKARKQTELQLSLGTATMNDLVGDLSLEDQARSRLAVHRAQSSLACHQLALIQGKL